MAFDENQQQAQPLLQEQSVQQQVQPQLIPQPQYMPTPQLIQQQLTSTMGKHKIRHHYECGTVVRDYENRYPQELINSLSQEEYSFIVDRLNKLLKRNKNISTMIVAIYLIAEFLMIGLLITGTTTQSFGLIYSFIGLNFALVILFLVVLLLRNRKYSREMEDLATEINSVYASRNIRLEITKKIRGRRYIYKAVLYFPLTGVVYVAPQMYSYQPQQLQQPSQTQYTYSPAFYQQQQQQQSQPQQQQQQQQQQTGYVSLSQ